MKKIKKSLRKLWEEIRKNAFNITYAILTTLVCGRLLYLASEVVLLGLEGSSPLFLAAGVSLYLYLIAFLYKIFFYEPRLKEEITELRALSYKLSNLNSKTDFFNSDIIGMYWELFFVRTNLIEYKIDDILKALESQKKNN